MRHSTTPATISVNERATVFANTVYLTVLTLNAYPGSFIALRTYQHDVRDVDRSFEFNNPWRHCSPLRLDLPLMLFTHVNALYYNSGLIRDYPDNLTAFTFILNAPTNDFYSVAFFNLDLHFTHSSYRSP
jgi:hypothetical protein